MKKSLLFISVLFIITASACKKESVVPNRTIVYTLNSADWETSNGGRTYTAAIDMPEIDDYFNEYGGVLVYVSFGDNVNEQIPQVYNGVSYSYITVPGQIVLEVQSSDGAGTITPPGRMKVKIVLIPSAD